MHLELLILKKGAKALPLLGATILRLQVQTSASEWCNLLPMKDFPRRAPRRSSRILVALAFSLISNVIALMLAEMEERVFDDVSSVVI